VAAAQRGDAASIYTFDEGLQTLESRGTALGMPIAQMVSAGRLRLQQIDPAEMSPGELTERVRSEVEARSTRVIVIDSLNGYLAAMPEEQFLIVQLHELFTFLRQRGVLAIVTVAQTGLFGHMNAPVDVSYLADTVLLLRFFEMHGEVRKVVSVLKRRMGRHASDICELTMDSGGVRLGARMSNLEGVLTGVPRSIQGSQ
jgi:circadian clock protein KaiC